ncbi:MAG: ECF-type sigma factor [Phycisphaerales bacterium]
MDPAIAQTTQLLLRSRSGDQHAAAELTPLVYDQLRRLAGSLLSEERAGHTLQPTALVHEAFVRLIDQRQIDEGDRSAFMGLAATIMRRVLVDHARARNRLKRGGGARRVALEATQLAMPSEPDDSLDLERLDEALQRLADMDERKAKIVELRFFGGLDESAAATAVGVSRATASREWRMARSWLLRELEQMDES